MSKQTETFDQWALVELMGRSKIVGKVTEATLGGGAFLRVDVPAVAENKAFTRFYRPEAIYCISPVTEEIALGLIQQYRHEPVSRFELPQIAEKASATTVDDGNDDDQFYGDGRD